jgi:hypothetical protein
MQWPDFKDQLDHKDLDLHSTNDLLAGAFSNQHQNQNGLSLPIASSASHHDELASHIQSILNKSGMVDLHNGFAAFTSPPHALSPSSSSSSSDNHIVASTTSPITHTGLDLGGGNAINAGHGMIDIHHDDVHSNINGNTNMVELSHTNTDGGGSSHPLDQHIAADEKLLAHMDKMLNSDKLKEISMDDFKTAEDLQKRIGQLGKDLGHLMDGPDKH